jgi:precorrin-6A/cobalt-precorrin-6A reductase
MPGPLHILILGGTSEARQLAERLAGDPNVAPILSLAGRTRNPVLPSIAHRIGGFGGTAGLIAYLKKESIDLVVDATHPFAEQMSAHAEAACRACAIPLVLFTRPPWVQHEGDRWQEVDDVEAAIHALGDKSRRVFLTVGRLQLSAFEAAPQHFYLIRSIDAPEPAPRLPHHKIILARGPFALDDERHLLEQEEIDVIVTKNSGGDATYAKIEAARMLSLPVILIRQPARADVPTFHDLEKLLHFISGLAHHDAPEPRGV